MAEAPGNLSPGAGLPLQLQDDSPANATVPSTAFTDSGTAQAVRGSLSDLLGGKLITFDEWDIGHLLSDAQLDTVSKVGDDESFNWLSIFIGTAVGFTQNIFNVFGAVSNGEAPSISDLLMAAIAVFSYAMAITKLIEFRRKKAARKALLGSIKDRKKIRIPVQAAGGGGGNAGWSQM